MPPLSRASQMTRLNAKLECSTRINARRLHSLFVRLAGFFKPVRRDIIKPMPKLMILLLTAVLFAMAADLPTKKYLNLAALKTLVAAAEAEMQKRSVQVTICIVDESGNLLFL